MRAGESRDFPIGTSPPCKVKLFATRISVVLAPSISRKLRELRITMLTYRNDSFSSCISMRLDRHAQKGDQLRSDFLMLGQRFLPDSEVGHRHSLVFLPDSDVLSRHQCRQSVPASQLPAGSDVPPGPRPIKVLNLQHKCHGAEHHADTGCSTMTSLSLVRPMADIELRNGMLCKGTVNPHHPGRTLDTNQDCLVLSNFEAIVVLVQAIVKHYLVSISTFYVLVQFCFEFYRSAMAKLAASKRKALGEVDPNVRRKSPRQAKPLKSLQVLEPTPEFDLSSPEDDDFVPDFEESEEFEGFDDLPLPLDSEEEELDELDVAQDGNFVNYISPDFDDLVPKRRPGFVYDLPSSWNDRLPLQDGKPMQVHPEHRDRFRATMIRLWQVLGEETVDIRTSDIQDKNDMTKSISMDFLFTVRNPESENVIQEIIDQVPPEFQSVLGDPSIEPQDLAQCQLKMFPKEFFWGVYNNAAHNEDLCEDKTYIGCSINSSHIGITSRMGDHQRAHDNPNGPVVKYSAHHEFLRRPGTEMSIGPIAVWEPRSGNEFPVLCLEGMLMLYLGTSLNAGPTRQASTDLQLKVRERVLSEGHFLPDFRISGLNRIWSFVQGNGNMFAKKLWARHREWVRAGNPDVCRFCGKSRPPGINRVSHWKGYMDLSTCVACYGRIQYWKHRPRNLPRRRLAYAALDRQDKKKRSDYQRARTHRLKSDPVKGPRFREMKRLNQTKYKGKQKEQMNSDPVFANEVKEKQRQSRVAHQQRRLDNPELYAPPRKKTAEQIANDTAKRAQRRLADPEHAQRQREKANAKARAKTAKKLADPETAAELRAYSAAASRKSAAKKKAAKS